MQQLVIVEFPTRLYTRVMTYKKWTFEEVELLKSFYPTTRVKDLIEKFPNRNKATIVIKALSLSLSSAKLWQSKEDGILKRHFNDESVEKLLTLLPHRSWKAIIARGERLGLSRKRDKPRLRVNEEYFKSWSNNMAYVLGFILADGCIIKGTYKGYSDSLKFGVQLSDIDILEKIKKELKAEHKISLVKNAAHFCISSQILVNALKKLSIFYRKSLNEHLPNVPAQYVKDFIRGIVDGDGGMRIDKKGQPSVGVCGGEKVLLFIRGHFLEELGVYSKIGRRSYSRQYNNFLYEIRYKSTSALKILAYLYYSGCLSLNRKYKLANKCLEIKIKERKNFSGKKHL